MLAKRWREHGDRDAAHKLVTSHLRLVAKIAMGYRGYGLPISEVISEGNIGLMRAVRHFEPERGFRLATYAVWSIKAAIREYVLRSWSLVKIGATANQKKLSSTCARQEQALGTAGWRPASRPGQAHRQRLGVSEQDVVDMNRRLSGDASLNAPIGENRRDSGECQDWLVDDGSNQEERLAAREEADNCRQAVSEALSMLDERERQIFEARLLADDPIRAGGSGGRVRRLARARAPNRGPRFREGADVSERSIRSRTPLQLVGLYGLDSSQALRAPVRPVHLISPSSRKLGAGPQKAMRYGSPVRSTAQMIRAFLLATATVARLNPRRSQADSPVRL